MCLAGSIGAQIILELIAWVCLLIVYLDPEPESRLSKLVTIDGGVVCEVLKSEACGKVRIACSFVLAIWVVCAIGMISTLAECSPLPPFNLLLV